MVLSIASCGDWFGSSILAKTERVDAELLAHSNYFQSSDLILKRDKSLLNLQERSYRKINPTVNGGKRIVNSKPHSIHSSLTPLHL